MACSSVHPRRHHGYTHCDKVTDFKNGADTLEFSNAVFAELTIADTGGDTVVSWDRGQVTLLGGECQPD
jgi:hypothetical protein